MLLAILGGVGGFMVGGPVGALAGAAAGAVLSKKGAGSTSDATSTSSNSGGPVRSPGGGPVRSPPGGGPGGPGGRPGRDGSLAAWYRDADSGDDLELSDDDDDDMYLNGVPRVPMDTVPTYVGTSRMSARSSSGRTLLVDPNVRRGLNIVDAPPAGLGIFRRGRR